MPIAQNTILSDEKKFVAEQKNTSFEDIKSEVQTEVQTEIKTEVGQKISLKTNFIDAKFQELDNFFLRKNSKSQHSFEFFWGYLGFAAIIIGTALFLKLSVNEGVLPPAIQVYAPIGFGIVMIASRFLGKWKDKSYISLLNATGFAVVLLSLLVGNIGYDYISTPVCAIGVVATVLCCSLFAEFFEARIFLPLAALGAYGGIYLLESSLNNKYQMVIFAAFSLVSFSFFSLRLRLWQMLPLLTVCCFVVGLNFTNIDKSLYFCFHVFLFIIQSIFYFLFKKNPEISLKIESSIENLTLASGFLLTYFSSYFALADIVVKLKSQKVLEWNAIFSLFAIAILMLLNSRIAKFVKEKKATKPEAIILHSFSALIFLHSIFGVHFNANDRLYFLFSLALIALILQIYSCFQQNKNHLLLPSNSNINSEYEFSAIFVWAIAYVVCCVFVAFQMYLSSFTSEESSSLFRISIGAAFGLLLLHLALQLVSKQVANVAVFLSVVALLVYFHQSVQLVDFVFSKLEIDLKFFSSATLGRLVVSVLWGLVAVIIIKLYISSSVKVVNKAAQFVLLISTCKVFLFDVQDASPLVRALCFLILGLLLFFGGASLRKLKQID